MAYFPIMLMGKVENPRSQTPPCMSDGIQDIFNMHNVEILEKKKKTTPTASGNVRLTHAASFGATFFFLSSQTY